MRRPVVVVVSRRTTRKNQFVDYVGEAHLQLLIRLKTLPVIVPVVKGILACLPEYSEEMHGLLLVEGEDIESRRYKHEHANLQYVEKTDAIKDEIELRLIRLALRREIPYLGICRGAQILNVACGGTLYGDVQKEKQSSRIHISPGEEYDTYRHPIKVAPGTPLARWYGLETLEVNSYHHQGVRRLAKRFQPMAHADDGLIEAYYDPRRPFLVGLQFHPERMLPDYRGNFRVWQAFAAAVHENAGAAPRR